MAPWISSEVSNRAAQRTNALSPRRGGFCMGGQAARSGLPTNYPFLSSQKRPLFFASRGTSISTGSVDSSLRGALRGLQQEPALYVLASFAQGDGSIFLTRLCASQASQSRPPIPIRSSRPQEQGVRVVRAYLLARAAASKPEWRSIARTLQTVDGAQSHRFCSP